MDIRAILLPISRFLLIISGFMLLPALADILSGNPDWKVFATSAVVLGGLGTLMVPALRGQPYTFRLQESFLLVNLAWVGLSVICAVPLYASGLHISFVDALFEASSGLTTTGSTVLTGLDELPPGILLWRSLLQWIGGLGIVVMGIMLLPALRVGGQQLFLIESSEDNAKPFGRTEYFVRRIVAVYIGLTVTCAGLYYEAGMTGFEAINHALTTISTGGFSTSDDSLGHFHSLTIDWIAIVFMLVSSLPFLFLITLIEKRRINAFRQVVFFLALTLVLTMILFAVSAWDHHAPPWLVFTSSAFHVASIISTTGFVTDDYLQWGSFAVCFFFLLTFVGGCNGSTAGGFKIFRIMILLSFVRARLRVLRYPRRVTNTRLEDTTVSTGTIESVVAFAILYVVTFAAFALAYSAFDVDIDTALSASITALANVGPGIGTEIGPVGNFADMPSAVKLLQSLEMILGRLELLGGILVLLPDFWLE